MLGNERKELTLYSGLFWIDFDLLYNIYLERDFAMLPDNVCSNV